MEYTIRDRGRELGSFSLEQLEAKLDDHQIGMMAEVYDGEKWITIAELIEGLEEVDRRKAEKLEEEHNQRAEIQALEQEAKAQRDEEEQRRRETELEIQKQRTRQKEVDLEREAHLLENRADLLSQGSAQNFHGITAAANLEPHRGSTILVLGILSLFFCGIFTGIPAWVMGKGDLGKIRAGSMDPAGKGSTNAGMVCGMISCIINLVVFGFALLGDY
ncbi:MAG TPA: DUF4190 domain-containing protein [Candidatus Marinimicrobia bacterium]|nr:DUF4190 domain-containing protein [Candidatus Neomarinimicrobiota bacterium]